MSFEKEFEIMRKAEQAGVAFHHAMGVMFYDAETVAPEKSVEGRGRTLSFLGDIQYGMMTDPELMAAIETLKAHKDDFGPDEQREIELSDIAEHRKRTLYAVALVLARFQPCILDAVDMLCGEIFFYPGIFYSEV